jgi:Fe-S oxidoreductase
LLPQLLVEGKQKMNPALISPSQTTIVGLPATVVYTLLPVVGIVLFGYMIHRRLAPMLKAAPDRRTNNLSERFRKVIGIWLFQRRHLRYLAAGVLHILLFSGFLILGLRSMEMIFMGILPGFDLTVMIGGAGQVYEVVRSYAATWVLAAALIAMVRRGVVRPARYAVPARYGKDHTGEALFVLALIAILMVSESLFEGSLAAAEARKGLDAGIRVPLSLAWASRHGLTAVGLDTLQAVHSGAYFAHELTFFTLLCFLPVGKHFHVVTSLFNVFFMRLRTGTVKPVRHGVDDAQLDDLESFGVRRLEDFTWKHILDFYSCADCGRCSDNCPANAAGRPLSPRFISIKGRNRAFDAYPVLPRGAPVEDRPLMGGIFEADEIWSCTTCGACEQECPLGIEYIDKIVDLRRGMVDDGMVPQSLQKPLGALEKRGNPWGKLEKKRVEWVKELGEDVPVKVLDGKTGAELLYFVDSITAFDDRMQSVARATAERLHHTGADFGILGKVEKDSGHEVRRFGEEMLFQDLRAHNTEMIMASGAEHIVTADPHAYNALKHDYEAVPPVEHISQYAARMLRVGKLRLKPLSNGDKVYTYHDPCYLGRHNAVYEDPRMVLDAIGGLKRVDMPRCRDRSFCCGGGGLMLFYEPEEEERMGVLRVKMAVAAGADIIVTACPFCLVNVEDAIKVAGLEDRMEAIDLAELVANRLTE